jgi:dienelactone hydrolase
MLAFLAAVISLAGMQEVMGPLPRTDHSAPTVQVLEEVRLEKYTRRKITYLAEPGDAVPAYLLIPHQRSKRAPAMLVLHQTVKMGKDEPVGLGGKANLHFAHELAERGYVTLAPDYPNFGEYKIDVYAKGYVSATMKGIFNHIRAVDLLSSMPEVDPKRIGVIGHSLGGHNALFVAAFDPRIKAVVTSCGFTSFAKYFHGDLTGWSHKGYMPRIAEVYGKDPKRMPFDFPDVLNAIAPRAIFINAPVHDTNFDVSGVRDCIAAVKNKKRLKVVYPDAGHDFPLAERLQAYEFFGRQLR